jgi:hypothetical protein
MLPLPLLPVVFGCSETFVLVNPNALYFVRKVWKVLKHVTVHIVTSCDTLQEERDELWCDLINIGSVQVSVSLYNMEDTITWRLFKMYYWIWSRKWWYDSISNNQRPKPLQNVQDLHAIDDSNTYCDVSLTHLIILFLRKYIFLYIHLWNVYMLMSVLFLY